ncbi:MAG TPA: universal stress protein, partial [Dongiaceae bacterium]|nr:universal stress protein [Dongiaceae bacterium]
LASVAQDLARIEGTHLQEHRQLLERTEAELRAAGLEVILRLVDGDPRHALVDVARQERVDLLVVGSHGHSGIGRTLMGCVASHVVGHAHCDVMVVRRDEPAPVA